MFLEQRAFSKLLGQQRSRWRLWSGISCSSLNYTKPPIAFLQLEQIWLVLAWVYKGNCASVLSFWFLKRVWAVSMWGQKGIPVRYVWSKTLFSPSSLFCCIEDWITQLKKVTCTFFTFFPPPPSQTSVVNYIDQRTKPRSDQLFFVVFEWKDPFIQTVQDVSNLLAPSWIVRLYVLVCVYVCLWVSTWSEVPEEEWSYSLNFSLGCLFVYFILIQQ